MGRIIVVELVRTTGTEVELSTATDEDSTDGEDSAVAAGVGL
jgi:hypothetical protein